MENSAPRPPPPPPTTTSSGFTRLASSTWQQVLIQSPDGLAVKHRLALLPPNADLAVAGDSVTARSQDRASITFLGKYWCQGELCLLCLGLAAMVTLNLALLLWIVTFIDVVHSGTGTSPVWPLSESTGDMMAIRDGLVVNSNLHVHHLDSAGGVRMTMSTASGTVLMETLYTDTRFESDSSTGNGSGLSSWITPSSTLMAMSADGAVANSANVVIRSSLTDQVWMSIKSSEQGDHDADDFAREATNLIGTRNGSQSRLIQGDKRKRQSVYLGLDSIRIDGELSADWLALTLIPFWLAALRPLSLSHSVQVAKLVSSSNLHFVSHNKQVLVRGPSKVHVKQGTRMARGDALGDASARWLSANHNVHWSSRTGRVSMIQLVTTQYRCLCRFSWTRAECSCRGARSCTAVARARPMRASGSCVCAPARDSSSWLLIMGRPVTTRPTGNVCELTNKGML